ncbi:MAG TPA: DUF6702 family protein [Pyrinomonadaceae bacterium]|nr:DUF6702 family protein [Pyrinomonadaceae bacterium]
MKFTSYILSLAFVASALALPHVVPAAAAHKFHTSFTEAEYNAREHSLEITLRTFPDDLENILSKRNGKAVRLDRKKEAEPLLVAYLQETFQLKTARGETVKLSWVGMDSGVDSAWLYIEARMPDGFAGAQLRNQFLFDLYDDQINLVNVKQEDRKRALTFKNGDSFQPLAPQ